MDSNFVAVTQADVQYVDADQSSVILVEQVVPAYIEVINNTPTYVEVVTKGPQGPPGDVGDVSLFLQKENHLSEYANDPQAQQSAQINLGFGMVDPLAYYILAKA